MRWLQPCHVRLAGLALALAGVVGMINTTRMAMADEKDKDEKGRTVTLIEKDSGTKVKLATGDTLLVKLEMQAGTGFSWAIAKNDKEQLLQQGKVEIEKPSKLPGGKATQVFRFKAEKTGTSDLELQYKRPFEKDKEPARTFKVTVTIEKPTKE